MIFASNNKGKINEIKKIFNDTEILSLKDANINIEIEEDQNTFYGNALKKAQEIYKITKIPVIADDSGLCIEELNDWPGVMTHRFAGDKITDEEKNKIIIEKLKDIENKRAKVICNLVYYDGTSIQVGEGIIEGKITLPRGKNGFGFDPIFELNTGKTLAELTPEAKNNQSARYLAAIDLKKKIKK
jgi:XTP/dITP diphosphohydrolase